MSEDILERAKKADIDLMAITDWGQLRDLFGELIAEVEAKNDKIAQDAITIQMHHGNVLTLQKEVERLRSENRELKKTDVWANDVIKEHESLKGQIAAKDARIKELSEQLAYEKEYNSIAEEEGFHHGKEDNAHTLQWQSDYIKRLEAAFLEAKIKLMGDPERNHSWYPNDETWNQYTQRIKTTAEKKAREALERIKEGGKDVP